MKHLIALLLLGCAGPSLDGEDYGGLKTELLHPQCALIDPDEEQAIADVFWYGKATKSAQDELARRYGETTLKCSINFSIDTLRRRKQTPRVKATLKQLEESPYG